MAELMYLPEPVATPPVNVRVKFWNITDWDPYDSRTDSGVHVVKDGNRAGVYLADGTQLFLLKYLPTEQAASFGNLVLRSLVTEGFVDRLYLPDELRSGTRRDLQPGRCLEFNGSNQYVGFSTIPALAAGCSLSIWLKPDVTTDQAIVCFNGTTVRGLSIAGNSFLAYDNVANYAYFPASPAIPTTTWTHIAVVFATKDARDWQLYRNGVAVANGSIHTGTWTDVTSLDIGAGYTHTGSNFNGKLFDCRLFARTLTAAEVAVLADRALAPITGPTDTTFHCRMDQDYSVSIKDSSGNNNHGLLINPVFNTSCFYQGVDVPYSFHNQVGWSKANTSPNLNTDVAGSKGWVGYGTTPPTVATGTYFGKFARATTFTAASATGYAGSRAQYNTAGVTQTNGVRYRQSHSIRASRNLVASEVITVYWTGSQGHHPFSASSSDDIVGRWKEIVIPDDAASTNGTEYPVVYLTNAVASDITFYLADDAMFVDYGNPIPRNESVPTKDILGNLLQYSGQCPILPKQKQSHCVTLSGSTQYANCGTGTWDTDGTQAMEISGWFKVPVSAGGTIVGSQLDSAPYTGWLIQVSGGQFYFTMIANYGSGDYWYVLTKQAGFNDGAWHYFRVTYDGSKSTGGVSITIDGVQQSVTNRNGAGDNYPPSTKTFTGSLSNLAVISCIGGRNGTGTFLSGYLADINITIGKKWWRYKCSEGLPSAMLLDSGPFANHGTLVNYADAMWTTKQDVVHLNLTEGFRSTVNLLKWSEALDNAAWSKNQLTVTPNAIADPFGATSADLVAKNTTNSSTGCAQAVPVSNTAYTFSFYAKAGPTSSLLGFGIYTGSWPAWTAEILSGPGTLTYGSSGVAGGLPHVQSLSQTEWTRIRVTSTVPAGTCWVSFYPGGTGSVVVGDSQYIACLQVEQGSVATEYKKSLDIPGTCYTPRRDAVNMLRYSEQFDNAVWTKSQTTVTANQVVAPDGVTTMDRLNDDAASSDHQVYQSMACPSGTTYTLSAYVKYGNIQYITVKDGYSMYGKVFDVQNGNVIGNGGFSAPTSATITNVGGGIFRVSITFTTNTTNLQFSIKMHPSTTGSAYVGGSGYIYIWGAQIEYGTVPTAYAKTEDMPGPPGYKLSLLDSLGLPITHPAGEWHNLAETLIDFTAGQPLAPEFAGSSPPTAYAAGTTVSGLSKQSLTNKERKYELVKV